ncbi:MAG: hypothetical protein ABF760_01590 [Zymomonas mobilis]|uniref:Uncharacterized protein n=1 Tax=Zymomonas mobilis TaxID=542 RepID=A0A542VZ61_ZYMMB|nr:hypothetical protein [Zymomonas mobilis]TQL16610.1 hypothetical protein FBY58_0146 [Zymomonas mobilis]
MRIEFTFPCFGSLRTVATDDAQFGDAVIFFGWFITETAMNIAVEGYKVKMDEVIRMVVLDNDGTDITTKVADFYAKASHDIQEEHNQ